MTRRNRALVVGDPAERAEILRLARGGVRRSAPRRDREHELQVAFFDWARANLGRWPALELLYAAPNVGDNRNPVAGARKKAEGRKRGVLDIHLPVRRQGYTGLWIEMKTPEGSLSPEQRWWADHLTGEGHSVWVCRSLGAAMAVVLQYLGAESALPPEAHRWTARETGKRLAP